MSEKNVRVGVGVLIYKEDKVLMVKRTNSHGSGTWAPPGGHLEYGENPIACAIRECKEEVDLEIANVRFKCLTNDIFEEEKHYITIWMEADYVNGLAKVNAKDELTEIGWYKLEHLPQPLFLPVTHFLEGKTYHN